jgi:peptidoglycan/xylan/chitin deacetylase (PgdA/CDA1 family)
MRLLRGLSLTILLAGSALVAAPVPALASGACAAPGKRLSVSRIIEIDTAGGPLYGDHTRYAKEPTFLAPKEVVLTFDDGPMPWITRAILDTLDRYCTKATFFSVGRMALAYPDVVREVMARGHTMGSHTQTHPLNLKRLRHESAVDEIERGFAAIALAAGQPIAPFFRFPGLSDSPALLEHLRGRGVATFTVDVISDDSYISDQGRLARVTLSRLEARDGGIVLFHDIKPATARALPGILAEIEARGYRVVHLRAKAPHQPLAHLADELAPRLAKSAAGKPPLVPFYGAVPPPAPAVEVEGVPVTALAPPARPFDIAALARERTVVGPSAAEERPRARRPRTRSATPSRTIERRAVPSASWATTVDPLPRLRWPGD